MRSFVHQGDAFSGREWKTLPRGEIAEQDSELAASPGVKALVAKGRERGGYTDGTRSNWAPLTFRPRAGLSKRFRIATVDASTEPTDTPTTDEASIPPMPKDMFS